MHPAFSVIFFTVSSGAGFGLFALLYLADALKLGGLAANQILFIGILALLLIAAGLISSTFHLANPKNAWRAVSRFRTSWLSREGVFAIAFFPIAMAYLGLTWLDAHSLDWLRLVVGALATLLAWVTVFATGMIYACLKTIRQWNTPLVPLNYLALGHFSGALLLVVAPMKNFPVYVLVLLIFAALLKGVYYFWIKSVPGASTIQTATGFTRAQVKLLDAGHTHGTFLTQEFGFQLARRHALALKVFVFVAGFGFPLLGLSGLLGEVNQLMAGLVSASAILGVLAERWLFFAEARHVVNLYHGAPRC
jgi:DMSO reductase anchor subunit